MSNFHYKHISSDGKARLGQYLTPHGVFETPMFMPVGTKASVKGVDVERLGEIGAQIMLVNTYHLWLRPGHELVRRVGGIHNFSGWSGPILSDSGGYQVFSLRGIRKITEEGVEFRSHIDGAKCFLSPEGSVNIQETLGVDIAMVLDECPAADLSHSEVEKSLSLTLRWAKRCLESREHPEQTALFGITQGGKFEDLRSRAANELSQLKFDGFAVGGLSVGEDKKVMYDVLSYHPSQLPVESVRYLMGVGTPEDILTAIYNGIDLFDCVMPTRAGRFGRAFVNGDEPHINIKNSRFAEDSAPLDSTCSCIACRRYSRAYLNHLFKNDEMLGPQLLSVHNLSHYLELMKRAREAIRNGVYEALYRSEIQRWNGAGATTEV